jgi:4-hydroxybenzoyl-CoA thioesterase
MMTTTQRIRVEWAHCDPAGIIFNPHYYIWMDSGTHALLQAAGFDLIGQTHTDNAFRGCPLVASQMEFKRPLYFGDVTLHSSTVEKFGNTSFQLKHEFSQGDIAEPVAMGREVRVWGGSDSEHPEKLVALPVPEVIKTLLSVEQTVDVTV